MWDSVNSIHVTPYRTEIDDTKGTRCLALNPFSELQFKSIIDSGNLTQ